MSGVTVALAGFLTGLSLIVAIGAQNAFVLRQGLRREHVGLIVTLCAASDAALIVLGIAGVGAVIDAAPAVITAIRWGGAAFLTVYGVLAARRALRPGSLTTEDAGQGPTKAAVVAACMAFTWLNPHVYLDTVVMLGSVANTHGGTRWWFGTGAALGSVTWFAALGYGARFLKPVFSAPLAWRILDGLIAVMMIAIAASLLLGS